MNSTKSFVYRLVTWLIIGFMLVTNLVNLTTNQQVNSYVSKASLALLEYYNTIIDVSLKPVTDIALKITNGCVNVNPENAALPSENNKKEKNSDNALAILVASDYKNINTFYSDSFNSALISNSIFNKVNFFTSSFLNYFCIISLLFICLFGLARSDTEDNNIKNNNIFKFRLV